MMMTSAVHRGAWKERSTSRVCGQPKAGAATCGQLSAGAVACAVRQGRCVTLPQVSLGVALCGAAAAFTALEAYHAVRTRYGLCA